MMESLCWPSLVSQVMQTVYGTHTRVHVWISINHSKFHSYRKNIYLQHEDWTESNMQFQKLNLVRLSTF